MAEVQRTTLSGEMTQRFIEFVMMQAQQAAMFLGQIPHPETGKGEVNLDFARMFIDQLEMIQEKTKGNLTSEESKVIANALSNLQMAFVEASHLGRAGGSGQEPAQAAPASPEPEDAAASVEPAGAGPKPESESEPESRKKFTKSYGA